MCQLILNLRARVCVRARAWVCVCVCLEYMHAFRFADSILLSSKISIFHQAYYGIPQKYTGALGVTCPMTNSISDTIHLVLPLQLISLWLNSKVLLQLSILQSRSTLSWHSPRLVLTRYWLFFAHTISEVDGVNQRDKDSGPFSP